MRYRRLHLRLLAELVLGAVGCACEPSSGPCLQRDRGRVVPAQGAFCGAASGCSMRTTPSPADWGAGRPVIKAEVRPKASGFYLSLQCPSQSLWLDCRVGLGWGLRWCMSPEHPGDARPLLAQDHTAPSRASACLLFSGQ